MREDTHADFEGSIPEAYDAYLGPLLFEFSGEDLARRVAGRVTRGPILEIACGTGISTEFLRRALARDVEIVATDLNPGMIEFARSKRGALGGVRFEVADAQALPFDSQSFGAVVCQFGIMFFPDLPKACSEMRRVARPGSFVACNVWDTLEANPVAGLAHETISLFFEDSPPTFLEVPFGSCAPEPTREIFRQAGFEDVEVEAVEATVQRPSALEVARGFVEGNPGVLEIRQRATASPDDVARALAGAIEERFGPPPLGLRLREYVISATTPG